MSVGFVVHRIIKGANITFLGGCDITGANYPDADTLTTPQIYVASILKGLLVIFSMQAAYMPVVEAALGANKNFKQWLVLLFLVLFFQLCMAFM